MEKVLLPIERALLDIVERLQQIRDRSEELLDLSNDTKTQLRLVNRLARRVEATEPRKTVRRSVVAQSMARAGRLAEELIAAAVDASVEDWIDEGGFNGTQALDQVHPRHQKPWSQVLEQNFAAVVKALGGQSARYFLIGESASDNAVLVLLLSDDASAGAIGRAYARCLNATEKDREQRRLLLPVVHVALDTGETPELPKEVVEVMEEVESGGFWSRLFGSAPRRRKEERDVEGWRRFALDPELANLGDLAGVLDEISYLREQSELE